MNTELISALSPIPTSPGDNLGLRAVDLAVATSRPDLQQRINGKIEQTQEWVYSKYGPDYHALFLLEPHAWADFPPEVQAYGGEAMAEILEATYPPHGESYPLPEFIRAPFNTEVIASGAVKPYFGFIAPAELTEDAVYANPELLLSYRDRLQPIAVSARVEGTDGSHELGRSAKMPGYDGFRAGALILQSHLDWLDHPRAQQSHSARAEVRASAMHVAHDGSIIPDSGATQTLYFGELGLTPTRFVPAYVVGDRLEPFVIGEDHRGGYIDMPVFTPAGPHVGFIEALSEYQGAKARPIIVPDNGIKAYEYNTTPQSHDGGTVYAKMEIVSGAKAGKHGWQKISDSLAKLDATAPMVMVKVPTHTEEWAATQEALRKEGFIFCGFEPAHEVPAANSRRGRKETVPPVVYMARIGHSVRIGAVPIAPAYFPGKLYGERLREEFEKVDKAFRDAVAA